MIKIDIKRMLAILFFAFLFSENYLEVSASAGTYYKLEGNNTEVTLPQLISKYKDQSIDYGIMKSSYELEAANYELAKEEYHKAIVSGDMQMKAKANLQVDLLQFYDSRKENLIEEAGKKLEFEFVKNFYSLMCNKEKKDYYSTYADYLETAYKVEYTKYRKGFSTEEKVNDAKADIDVNSGDSLENCTEYNNLIADIETDISEKINFTVLLQIPTQEINYDKNVVTASFFEKNNQYKLLQNQKKSYENYLTSLEAGSKEYNQGKLKVNDYSLQISKMRKDMESYAKNAINSYHTAAVKWKASESKLSVAQNNCVDKAKQYQKGKISKLQLLEADVKKESVEINYYENCYQVILWSYIVENSIYGAKL